MLAALFLLQAPDVPRQVVAHAREQLAWGTRYDPAYVKLTYPGGDVPRDRGVCTDVIVRAYRGAGYDLQRLVHEDMRKAWQAYPKLWGLKKPDPSIDHRRVPNLAVFFRRHGKTLSTQTTGRALTDWQPGDIVTWILDNGRDHIGIVTDRKNRQGVPLVVHNLSSTAEEDCLLSWKITGHYRWP
jgi:uncharacterized protein YijF (DUF1287 family)